MFFKILTLLILSLGNLGFFNFSETWQPWRRSTLDVSIIQSESKEDSRFIRLITTVVVVIVADNSTDRRVRIEFWALMLQGTKVVVVVVLKATTLPSYGRRLKLIPL